MFCVRVRWRFLRVFESIHNDATKRGRRATSKAGRCTEPKGPTDIATCVAKMSAATVALLQGECEEAHFWDFVFSPLPHAARRLCEERAVAACVYSACDFQIRTREFSSRPWGLLRGVVSPVEFAEELIAGGSGPSPGCPRCAADSVSKKISDYVKRFGQPAAVEELAKCAPRWATLVQAAEHSTIDIESRFSGLGWISSRCRPPKLSSLSREYVMNSARLLHGKWAEGFGDGRPPGAPPPKRVPWTGYQYFLQENGQSVSGGGARAWKSLTDTEKSLTAKAVRAELLASTVFESAKITPDRGVGPFGKVRKGRWRVDRDPDPTGGARAMR